MKKILFDKTHGEVPKLSDAQPGGLSMLYGELKAAGYSVEPITKDFAASLGKADVLWISFPTKDFSADECRAVADFVKAGKGLFVTAELGDIYGNVSKLNAAMTDFGVSFKPDCVIDKSESVTQMVELTDRERGKVSFPGGTKIPQFVLIKNFREHPITNGIKEVGYFAGCTIEAPEDKFIAWSGPESFGDLNANARWDPGEKIGAAGIAIAAAFGAGRFACLGDTSIITNKYLSFKDNTAFIKNTMVWLAGDA